MLAATARYRRRKLVCSQNGTTRQPAECARRDNRCYRGRQCKLMLFNSTISVIGAVATLGVIARPWNSPECVWATAGAAMLVLFNLMSWQVAVASVGRGTDVGAPAAARCGRWPRGDRAGHWRCCPRWSASLSFIREFIRIVKSSFGWARFRCGGGAIDRKDQAKR
jgi:hypothetical protein